VAAAATCSGVVGPVLTSRDTCRITRPTSPVQTNPMASSASRQQRIKNDCMGGSAIVPAGIDHPAENHTPACRARSSKTGRRLRRRQSTTVGANVATPPIAAVPGVTGAAGGTIASTGRPPR